MRLVENKHLIKTFRARLIFLAFFLQASFLRGLALKTFGRYDGLLVVKSDMQDSQSGATLHAHGLLQSGFVFSGYPAVKSMRFYF